MPLALRFWFCLYRGQPSKLGAHSLAVSDRLTVPVTSVRATDCSCTLTSLSETPTFWTISLVDTVSLSVLFMLMLVCTCLPQCAVQKYITTCQDLLNKYMVGSGSRRRGYSDWPGITCAMEGLTSRATSKTYLDPHAPGLDTQCHTPPCRGRALTLKQKITKSKFVLHAWHVLLK